MLRRRGGVFFGLCFCGFVKGDLADVCRVKPLGVCEEPVNRRAATQPACDEHESYFFRDRPTIELIDGAVGE